MFPVDILITDFQGLFKVKLGSHVTQNSILQFINLFPLSFVLKQRNITKDSIKLVSTRSLMYLFSANATLKIDNFQIFIDCH